MLRCVLQDQEDILQTAFDAKCILEVVVVAYTAACREDRAAYLVVEVIVLREAAVLYLARDAVLQLLLVLSYADFVHSYLQALATRASIRRSAAAFVHILDWWAVFPDVRVAHFIVDMAVENSIWHKPLRFFKRSSIDSFELAVRERIISFFNLAARSTEVKKLRS